MIIRIFVVLMGILHPGGLCFTHLSKIQRADYQWLFIARRSFCKTTIDDVFEKKSLTLLVFTRSSNSFLSEFGWYDSPRCQKKSVLIGIVRVSVYSIVIFPICSHPTRTSSRSTWSERRKWISTCSSFTQVGYPFVFSILGKCSFFSVFSRALRSEFVAIKFSR